MPINHINIRIGRLPGRIQEFVLNGDRTVATALATAGLDATGYEIRVQGQPATLQSSLAEGDIVLLVKKIKGNSDEAIVRVGRVPGPALVEYALDEPTVLAALNAAGITLAYGEVVYLNDRLASVGEPVDDGSTVIVKTAPRQEPDEEAAEILAAAGAEEEAETFASVPGTDAAELRAQAEDFREEAEILTREAEEAGRTARELRSKAAAYEDKAAAIESARTDLESARDRLVSLGVLRPQGEGMLTDILRVFGLRK